MDSQRGPAPASETTQAPPRASSSENASSEVDLQGNTKNTADATLMVQFDDTPDELIFAIVAAGTNDTVFSGPDYKPSQFELWNTTLFDIEFGEYLLLVSTSEKSFSGSVEVLVDGVPVVKVEGEFGDQLSLPFVIDEIDPKNPPEIVTNEQGEMPGSSLNILVQYGQHPEDMNWSILDSGETVYAGPQDYTPQPFQKWTTRFRNIPPGTYTLQMEVATSNALTTGAIEGFIKVTQKLKNRKKLLLKQQHGSFGNSIFNFTVI